MAKSTTPTRATVEALAEKLQRATYGAGCSDITPALTAAATAVILLGAPSAMWRTMLHHLATEPGERAAAELCDLWALQVKEFGYLDGFMAPLIGWAHVCEPGSSHLAAFQQAADLLTEIDMRELVDSWACRGDVLGPLYTLLRDTGGRRHLEAFYTPATVSNLMATVAATGEGATVHEPACGAGGMVVAIVREMRQRGLDPRTCTFALNDIDALAVALAGVNMSAHGIPRVTLRAGNALVPDEE